MRQMTDRGYDFLEKEEGERLFAYDDATGQRVKPGDPVRGTLTIGVGHTGPDVFPGQTISKQESRALFDKDTDWAEAAVDQTCPGANDNEFNAMVSLCFNIGEAGFRKSTVARLFNRGDKTGAASAFLMWCKTTVDGRMVDHPVLKARRAREAAMFLEPMPGEVPKPMPQAVEAPKGAASSTTLKTIAGGVVVPGAGVAVENAPGAIDQVREAVDAAQQAGTVAAAFKDLLPIFTNGHVLTLLAMALILGAAWFIWRRYVHKAATGQTVIT